MNFNEDQWIETETCWISKSAQGTFEWSKARKGRITMSNIGAMCGHSIFCETESQRKELAGTILGTRPRKKRNQAMILGNLFEPIARKYLSLELGKDIRESGFAVWKEDTRFGASPDGIIDLPNGEKIGIEIKCPKQMYHALEGLRELNPPTQEAIKNTVFRSHYDQMQGNMAVFGFKKMIYYVFPIEDFECLRDQGRLENINDFPSIRLEVEFDEEYWNDLKEGALEFYDTYMK